VDFLYNDVFRFGSRGRRKSYHRGRESVYAAVVVCIMQLLAVPSGSFGQSYEVLNEGIIHLGNRWEFDSVSGTVSFTTTWEFKRAEDVGGYSTIVLEEVSPYFIDDINVFLDSDAMTIVQIYETRTGAPTTHISATYSDPLEKIPRFVGPADNKRNFGHGESNSYVVEDPSQRWTRIQDQYVTYVGIEPVQVPAGTFQCIGFVVDESWIYDNGWTGVARREFWINPVIGPVAMNYEVWDYNSAATLVNYSSVSHQLRSFSPASTDLVVDQASVSPDFVHAGEPLTVNWREVAYYKDSPATHSTDVYLSTDTLVTDNDIRIVDAREIPPLAAGQYYEAAESVPVPAATPSGPYYVAVVVDVFDEVEELSERNTFLLQNQVTVEAKPDLTVAGGSFAPETVSPGEVVYIDATITNVGGTSAPQSAAAIYLSSDPVIEPTDYPLIVGIVVPSLDPQGSHTFSRAVFVPPGFAEGTYYVGVACDADGIIEEVDETNNNVALAGTLVVGRPDLKVSGGWFSPDLIYPGARIVVQAVVENVGSVTAKPCWVHIYLSPDEAITTGDTLLEAGLRLPSLDPGAALTVNAEPEIPPTTPLGDYYLGLIVDVGGEVAESNEANNAAVVSTSTLVVTTPPDLCADHFDFAPDVVNPGDLIALVGFIKNAGGYPADGGFWVEFYVSQNSDFSEPRQYLCESVRIPRLDRGEIFPLISLERTVYDSLTTGVYTVGLVIDRLGEVAESDKTNNIVWVSGKHLYVGCEKPAPTGVLRWELYR